MWQQRHKIIHNRVALDGEESVSGVTGGTRRRVDQENPPMRIYIIGNDGITLCREAPATVNEGEVAVASKEDLHADDLAASGCWHCGMLCLVSRNGVRLATARR